MRRCLVLAAAWLAACAAEPTPAAPPAAKEPEENASRREPRHIVVDHILIGVTHPRLEGVDRTPEQAKEVAYDVYRRLKAGESWDALKAAHSDDRGPDRPPGGPYALANHGVAAGQDEFPRNGMVPAFGDTGFALEVGDVAIAEYGPGSPYGFHIIKRVR